MASASTIRLQIENALAHKIPSALSPIAKTVRPVAPTGVEPLDALLRGGFPIGAVTELVGQDCSGRTSVALSFLAQLTQAGKVCAWIDVSNTLDPVSAAATGVDLERLLWVRCGISQPAVQRTAHKFALPEKYLVAASTKKGLHGGGFGSHPRGEIKGLSQAIGGLLRDANIPRCSEPNSQVRAAATELPDRFPSAQPSALGTVSPKPWNRIDQAVRTADLLLQGGGFSAIVLDMGSLAPDVVCRVPLATWHRYRLASERTQSSILLLSQHACAKSSAELLLRLHPANPLCEETTVFTGIQSHVEVVRQRFTQAESNVVPLRKPPQRSNTAAWACRTEWAGRR